MAGQNPSAVPRRFGFYDPDTQEMNTLLLSGDELGDELPPIERITYAHEYTHALQDQHFGLNDYLDAIVEEPDATLAAMSLVEAPGTLTGAHVPP